MKFVPKIKSPASVRLDYYIPAPPPPSTTVALVPHLAGLRHQTAPVCRSGRGDNGIICSGTSIIATSPGGRLGPSCLQGQDEHLGSLHPPRSLMSTRSCPGVSPAPNHHTCALLPAPGSSLSKPLINLAVFSALCQIVFVLLHVFIALQHY